MVSVYLRSANVTKMEIKKFKIFQKIHGFLDGIHLPMLDISLWGLLDIYVGGIFQKQIIRQAASVSWSFFLSLFPLILFILSVLPYLPHYEELYHYIFNELMPRILPDHMLEDVTGYIEQNIMPNIAQMSLFTIALVLIFATNGTYALINGFNHDTDTQRGLIREYLLAFLVTASFTVAIVMCLLGIYYAEVVFKLLMPEYPSNWFFSNLTVIIGYFSFPLVYCLALALLYWVGSVEITRFKQSIPGAILTTVLFMVVTYFFAFYVSEIARYNVLYGSVGSMILLMIWVDVNVVLIMFGNELNLAIKRIHDSNKQKNSNVQDEKIDFQI